MKRFTNNIRIGVVPRETIPSKSNEDQSWPNVPERTNHEPVKEQLKTQHTPGLVSPNHVGIHETNTTQPQNLSDMNSNISSAIPDSETQKINKLRKISSKAKWSTGKKILIGGSAAVIVGGCIAAAVILGVLLTRSTGAVTTTTTTVTTTTVSPTIVTAYWSFDNTSAELYAGYDGQLVNTPTYSPAGSNNTPYVGNGRAIFFTSGSNQSVVVPTYFNLSSTSFTIEAWIYPTSISGDRGIFGQCQCSTCTNQCLYLILRSGRLYIGFTSNDLYGSSSLSTNNWYHIAFVYNYQTQQQILYVNGVQDVIKSNAAAYQGTNGSIQIGSTQVYLAANYFSGYIDNLNLTTQAKSATDILRDGSVVGYYSFDSPNPSFDNGPNRLNATIIGTVTVPGRINQAIRIISSTYFIVSGLYNVPQGVSNNRSFSISMWINPSIISNSTFVQLYPSWGVTTNPCTNLLGIYSAFGVSGQLFVQSSNTGPSLISGPYVTMNTWTHISLTFSLTNGYTLYTNGIAFGASGATGYSASGSFASLYIGYSGTNCNSASVNAAYQGAIDELYIHSRELTQSDVTGLANP